MLNNEGENIELKEGNMNNREKMNKVRYDNIDILKTISIIMVIILHCLNWEINFIENKNITTYSMFFLRIFSEGVPIFIFVNGFLIINKQFDEKKHLKKILNIFILIIVWSVINIISIKYIKCESIQIKEVIKNILTTNINNIYTGPLWFLQNLIMLYLIFPVLKAVHDSNKRLYDYFFILVTIFTVGIQFINNILSIIDGIFKVNLNNYITTFVLTYNPINNGSFIFYFMLGGYIFEKKEIFEKKKNRIIAFILSIICIIISYVMAISISKITNVLVPDNFNYCSIFTAVFIIGLYAISYKYVNKNNFYNKIIMDIGKNTLGIYFVHKILIVLLYDYSIKYIFPMIILLLSYIIVRIMKKIPIIKKLIEI